MMTVDDYLDAALKANGWRYDSDIDRALGVKGNPISQWRTKRAWPNEAHMVQIARLAKLDEVQALVDLQIWKAKDADVQNAFQRIRQIVTSAAAALILLIAGQMIVFSNQADAADPVRIDCVEDYTLSQIISDFRTVTYALMMWLFALHFLLNLLPSG